MWTLKNVYNELSNNYAKNVVDLFKIIFPDSKVAEKMQVEPIKLKYVVNQGIALYVKEILKNEVNLRSIRFEVLQFWNKENNRVKDRYWDSKFLEHATHQHLLDCVHEGLKVFDMAKMVELPMDQS